MHPEDIALAKQLVEENTIETCYGPAKNTTYVLLEMSVEENEQLKSALRAIRDCGSKGQAVRIAMQALGEEGEE